MGHRFSANCGSVTKARRHGASAGRPWLGNNAANCWSTNIGPSASRKRTSASRKRRQGLPRRKTACATADVDVGTAADGAGRSDAVGLQKDGACSTHRENPRCAEPLPTSPAVSGSWFSRTLRGSCCYRNVRSQRVGAGAAVAATPRGASTSGKGGRRTRRSTVSASPAWSGSAAAWRPPRRPGRCRFDPGPSPSRQAVPRPWVRGIPINHDGRAQSRRAMLPPSHGP